MQAAADLAARQQALRLRSAELRMQLAEQANDTLPRPLALADKFRVGVNWLKQHPEWPAGALVLLLVLRPRRAVRIVTLAWSGWRAMQGARRWLKP